MVDKGIIRDQADLYFLTKEDLMKMDRMGDKLAQNLLDAIDRSRKPSLANLIYGLGIRNVGEHLATVLARNFKSITLRCSKLNLTQVHEIGPRGGEHLQFPTTQNLQCARGLEWSFPKKNELKEASHGKNLCPHGRPRSDRDEAEKSLKPWRPSVFIREQKNRFCRRGKRSRIKIRCGSAPGGEDPQRG
jgi:NAD-dependent DNA ligase